MNLDLTKLITEIHQLAVQKGWWEKDKERSFGDVISLIHSELSESLEFKRDEEKIKKSGINYMHHYAGKFDVRPLLLDIIKDKNVVIGDVELRSNVPTELCQKPDGLLPEIADAVIRIFDYIGKLGVEKEFVEILLEKHEFNKTRSYRHGGKAI